MIGLGDLEVQLVGGQLQIYGASGMGGGVSLRTGNTLDWRGTGDYAAPTGLSAPRELHLVNLDGAQVLLAPGQFGNRIDAWAIDVNGTPGAARPLTLSGPDAAANRGGITALEQMELGGQHIFVTASRYAPGLEVWTREGNVLRQTGQSEVSDFLGANTVVATALIQPGGVPFVLAAGSASHDLLAFALTPGGGLGMPVRLDLRDGLFIDTPTHIETVQIGGQSFAILGSAGSSSVSVIEISASGQMRVVHQINDTPETRFHNLAGLEVLQTPAGVFVLVAGKDNGLTLMTLGGDGRLLHLGSLEDEMREMALMDTGALEMVWRDGGLDIVISGEVLEGSNAGGRGVTLLRVEDVAASLPQLRTGDAEHVLTGTAGADLFVVSATSEDQVVRDFNPAVDRLDLSAMGRFYDLADLEISSTSRGAVIRLGEAQVTVFSHNRSRLREEDFTTLVVSNLGNVDTAPLRPLPAASVVASVGALGPDLLDGRAGADVLLGQPVDEVFDAFAAQVYRLYRATLDRDPDLRGLMNWTTRLESGECSLLEVVAGFTGSPEFARAYGDTSNRDFVTLLYDNVLDRAPDADGLANWSGRLERGDMSRAQVVQGFSESAEFRTETQAEALGFSRAGIQADFADDVYRLYRATLDRDPDLGGFTNWSERMAEGMSFVSVVSGFTGSAEFARAYGNTSDQAFVTLLYNNVLDRAPDAAGLANWTGRLERDEMSRPQVVQGFAQSTEFVAATMPDLTAWVQAQGIDDVLDGGGGRNILMGGLLADTFVFRAGDNGNHTVVDAEPWDTLRMEGFGYRTAADLALHLVGDGDDVLFTGAGVNIRFLDTDITTILGLGLELEF